MYYNNINYTQNERPQRAYEIEMHVREMEKKYALMNAFNRDNSSIDLLAGVKNTTRRIASVLAALFLG